MPLKELEVHSLQIDQQSQSRLSLVPIDPHGTARGFDGDLIEPAREALRMTASLYRSAGFEEPWICYLVLGGATPMGTCGFKSAPVDRCVEIAYATFPGHEGAGIGVGMAKRLVDLARGRDEGITLTAQTLPERSASTSILEVLDFKVVRCLEHPEDGHVWEWHLPPRDSVE